MHKFFSLEGRLFLSVGLALAVGFVLAGVITHWIEAPWLALLIAFIFALALAFFTIRYLVFSLSQRIDAIHNGMLNLLDDDFSVSLANTSRDRLGEVIDLYNRVTSRLRDERQYLYQREMLLDTVIQNSSLALVLTDPQSTVIYSNHNARHLFNGGKPIQGLKFEDILSGAPPVLREIIEQGRDGLFGLEEEGEENTYHMSLGRFVLNTQRHNLYLVKQMTKALSRQEVRTWKKVIRVISHELNNSLAPISSMAHSGKIMLEKQKYHALANVFETIAERSEHLKIFIESYASMAKLSMPVKARVSWAQFIQKLKAGFPFSLGASVPQESGYFDSGQMEQVMVNLLKNAFESGSEESEITVKVEQNKDKSMLEVCDRGNGMSKSVMESALLPYYTTKKSGCGIGLPLCREIIEAHDGELSVVNRSKGGLRVSITLPVGH